ncbi:MAG: GxxExxY protein [Planctomycetes bacterium]|nr:GxxExxY protein [Planctomycetota bacterium]
MPITLRTEVAPLSQDEFAGIAYAFMECVFAIHQDLGRFFEEDIYRDELGSRIPGAEVEFPIEITFGEFRTRYFIDVLVVPGAVFELKTVDRLNDRHRGQLLNYLLLRGVSHGKLANLRPERVQHEFVNTNLTRADRTGFSVSATGWSDFDGSHRELRAWLEAALRDWGAGLDLALYEQAVIHFFGGKEKAIGLVEVVSRGRRIGFQEVLSTGANAAVQITALPSSGRLGFEDHTRRFLRHTSLTAVQWINITRTEVTFKTIHRKEAL